MTLSFFYVNAYIMKLWKTLWKMAHVLWYCILHKEWNEKYNFPY